MGHNLITGDFLGKLKIFSRWQTLSAFIIFICLSIYALNADPFSGQTVAPFDRLLEFPGWSSVQSNRPAVHAERSDILDSQLPTWITLKAQIRKGETPLWYPNGAGGQPISLELFNPTFLLFLVVKDNALAYYLVGLAKLVVSGLGVYLLLKVFLRFLPSIWGGIVFMLCGFNAAWFFWEQVATAMWIPWLLWATVMYLRTAEKKWLPAITITSLLLILGGFPAVAGFGFYSFSLLILVWNAYNLFATNQEGEHKNSGTIRHFLKKTALPLLAVGIAFLLSAAALLPFINAMSGINLGYRTSGGMPLNIHDLLLFFTYQDPPRVENTVYVGVLACVFALVGVFPVFRRNDRQLRLFTFFNASLVIITLSIAFGFLPHKLIEAMPIFKNNPKWGRLLVVTLLGLSVLSAIGLDYIGIKLQELSVRYLRLTPLNAQRLIALVLIGCIGVQFYSQKELFNRFNAVVPSEWFYPLTPSIKYVKENLRPLQSVIADISYWFAGTLGAYGIPEWYAHSFRTDEEKKVLAKLVFNSAASPTSMLIDGSKIQFDSPLMNKMAIKYLLVNKAILEQKRLFTLPELSHELAPPLPDNILRQHIHLQDDMIIDSFGFMFGTYGKEHPPADVRIAIYNDKGQKLSLDPEIPKDDISDNKWGFFEFPGKVYFKKGDYSVVIYLVDYRGGDKVAVWATKSRNNTGDYLEINGVNTNMSCQYKIGYYEKIDPAVFAGKWNVLDLEKDILVFENKQVTNSAYFIKDLSPSDNQTDFSGLDVKEAAVDQIDIDYSRSDPGWIVLPMHRNPGWKAYVNNRQVKYDKYLDILPAIPVQGTSHIVFRYQAESFKKGLAVSLAGVFIFLVFSGLCLRRTDHGKEASQ